MSEDKLSLLALGALVFAIPPLVLAYGYRHTHWRVFYFSMLTAGSLLMVLAAGLWIAALQQRPPCIASHTEEILQPMLVDSVTILMPMKHEVCDRRALRRNAR